MINKIIKYLLYATVFLVPVFWVARDGLLMALISIVIVLWLFKSWRKRELFIKRTPFDYPLLALLVIYLFSS